MDLREFMIITAMFDVRPRVICKDGFSISIQAGEYHYCQPKKQLNDGNYKSLELGFPSTKEELLEEYTDFSGDVFCYVPFALVEKVLQKHKGIVDIEYMPIDVSIKVTKKSRELETSSFEEWLYDV